MTFLFFILEAEPEPEGSSEPETEPESTPEAGHPEPESTSHPEPETKSGKKIMLKTHFLKIISNLMDFSCRARTKR